MSWNDLPPHIQDTSVRVLTPKQLDAFKLHLAGWGYRRISTGLAITPGAARDRIHRAKRKLATTLKEAA